MKSISLEVVNVTSPDTCPEGLKRQTFYLNDELIEALREYSHEIRVGKSEIVRRAIQFYIFVQTVNSKKDPKDYLNVKKG